MKYLLSMVAVACVVVATVAFSENKNSWELYLAEQEKDYPGCVLVVRDQLGLLSEDEYADKVPMLLDACIIGRDIGEQRTRQIYGISKTSKPRKLGGYIVTITPPGSDKDEAWDVQY